MNSFIKKAAKAYRTVNYCLASAQVYLNEAARR